MVPSPEPMEIVELEVIRDLVERNVLVIACGGGGIPVIWKNGSLEGLEAVIDKDRASALLAAQLGVDLFVISTDTEFVYLHYKRPDQHPLMKVCASELRDTSLRVTFLPVTWGQRSNRCCVFCATAARKQSSPAAII